MEGIPMVLDPDEVFKHISLSIENDIDEEEKFHRKVLKLAGESTKKIHENTFRNLQNPLETIKRSINRVNDISLEDSIRYCIDNSKGSLFHICL